MELIKEWVTNIILFILFATVVDMLLPNSKFQKYTKMVVGLLLISIILTPIFKIFTLDFEETLASVTIFDQSEQNQIKNSIELQKNEIQASHDAYILEQMAVQLKEDAEEELMDRYGLVIADIHFMVNEKNQSFPDNLQKVSIQLKEPVNETDAVEVVKTIDVNTKQPLASETNKEQKAEITQHLSEKWRLDVETIDLHIEGGI